MSPGAGYLNLERGHSVLYGISLLEISDSMSIVCLLPLKGRKWVNIHLGLDGQAE